VKLKVNTLILGAGYSGLICQKRLDAEGIENFIVDQGSDIQFSDDDYVIVMRKKTEFCKEEPVRMITTRWSSPGGDFGREYSHKLYKIEKELKFPDSSEEQVFEIDNKLIQEGSKVYGNVTISNIDYSNKVARGYVTHLKKDVEIRYDCLISTIPLHDFLKLCGKHAGDFGIFIQFYPVGVIKKQMCAGPRVAGDIIMEYFSDQLIPFYRRHIHGTSVYYEYCINRPFSERFTAVIGPGKFTPRGEMSEAYSFFCAYQIYFAGRYATWDPDFNLDDICDENSKKLSVGYLNRAFKR